MLWTTDLPLSGKSPRPSASSASAAAPAIAAAAAWYVTPGWHRITPQYVAELIERSGSPRSPWFEQMRREIYPLARRLATRLTQEHHARRRGPLDFRRTVRASISTDSKVSRPRRAPAVA